MRHLFNSRVEVLRLAGAVTFGTPTFQWNKVDAVIDPLLGAPGELMCRLDLNFQRLGRDQPMPATAGRAPDRLGVMFFDVTDQLKAGDRVRCLTGPVTGTFEIRQVPDPAVDYSTAHHLEVQVVEVAQALVGVFPGAQPEGE